LASDGCVSAQGNDTKNQSDYRLSLSLVSLYPFGEEENKKKFIIFPENFFEKRKRKKIDQSASASFQ
jgi:hypothetical protein